MSFLQFKNLRIAGLEAGVPKNIINNVEIVSLYQHYDFAAFLETTGVKKRKANDDLTTSDLHIPAAEHLITDLHWNKSKIDAIMFVSQTPVVYL